MSPSSFQLFWRFLTQLKPKKIQEKANKIWIPVAVIAVLIAFTPLLFNLRESTLFPLSLKARDWTGFGGGTTEGATTSKELAPDGKTIIKTVVTDKKEDGKTLWDWLSVLGVPLTLAILGFWFQSSQDRAKADREKAEKRKEDREKERTDAQTQDKQREDALEAYFASMSDLLVGRGLSALARKRGAGKEDLLNEMEKFLLDAGMDVIRARTLSILRRLTDREDPKHTDGERKASVLLFLYDTELIRRQMQENTNDQEWALTEGALLDLSNADLRFAILHSAHLSGADLSGADLSGADLSGADLSGADLRLAHLEGADLCGANLSEAKLNGAKLNGAKLMEVNLRLAHLEGADLCGAKLMEANLGGAQIWQAHLCGANLSNAELVEAHLSGTDLSGADLSGADLSRATLGFATLSGADLSGAIFLATDLRNSRGLSQQQLDGEVQPLICNAALPEGIQVDNDLACDLLPEVLHNRHSEKSTIEEAQAYVNKARQQKWD